MKRIFKNVFGIFLVLFLTFCSKGGPRNDYEHFIQGKTEVDKNTLKLMAEYRCVTDSSGTNTVDHNYNSGDEVWYNTGLVADNTAGCIANGQTYNITVGDTTQIDTNGTTAFGVFTQSGQQVDKVSVATAAKMSFTLKEKILQDGVKYQVAMTFKSASGADSYTRLTPITLHSAAKP